MTFEEDLTKRRIDIAAFAAGEPERFAEWQRMYAQMHPNSFYMAIKMVINDVRRRFWLAEAVKPVAAPVTEAPAKPVVRRATIPGAAKPAAAPTPEPASSETTTETVATTPVPIKARPVIRRPIVANAETPPPVTPVDNPAVNPTNSAEAPVEAPKAPRPRPVFRKPAGLTENIAESRPDQEKIAQEDTNSELPFHTNPDPEATAPKPPRPRPVIRRPNPLQSSTEQTGTNVPAESLASKEISVNPVQPETTGTEQAPLVPKLPRPRPIFKRPAVPASTEENNTGEEKNTGVISKEVLNESSTPPAPETLTPVGPNHEAPPLVEPTAESVAAKPPRPRPIMRRPAPPAEIPPAPTESVLETPVSAIPEFPSAPEPTIPEPTEEPRKPPRPRPIFKRPTKPDEPGASA